MILLKDCEVFASEPLGKKDILLGGGVILAVENEISTSEVTRLGGEVIQASGLRAVPGFIDGHVHIAGSGGEGGPATRTPELQLSQMLKGGATTVIGLLGTDGFTRNLEAVLMKVKGLRAEGVSAWMMTGAYQVPTPTLLGEVGRDIALIEEVIGVGEIALSDHRSSEPSVQELIRLAVHARIGGMLGDKAGIVNVHMGDRKNPFDPIKKAVEQSDLHFTQFLPTHCNRNRHIFEEAKKYGLKSHLDLTSYPGTPGRDYVSAADGVIELLAAGVPLEHITTTSDGCGSMPVFDENGKFVKMGIGTPDAIYHTFKILVNERKLPWEQAIKVVSTNSANVFKLNGKGEIRAGKDADILLLDSEAGIHYLLANGHLMMKAGKLLKKGTFENKMV